MDDRTGKMYPSREDAIADGVPPEHIIRVPGPIESGPKPPKVKRFPKKVFGSLRSKPKDQKRRGR